MTLQAIDPGGLVTYGPLLVAIPVAMAAGLVSAQSQPLTIDTPCVLFFPLWYPTSRTVDLSGRRS